MADTLPAITNIQDEWIDVYSAVDVEVGTPLSIQNTGATTLLLRIQEDQPQTGDQGRHIYPLTKDTLNAGNSGLWVKNSPKSAGLSRLQVDILGGIDDSGVGSFSFPDSVHIQTEPETVGAGERVYLEVMNNSTATMLLEQVVSFTGSPVGNNDGVSLISLAIYMNPDDSGATASPSNATAFANGFDGEFVNVTNSGVIFRRLENFSQILNNDLIRITTGQVNYDDVILRELTSIGFNQDVTLARPVAIGVGKKFVIAVDNKIVGDSGADSLVAGYLSFRYLTQGERVAVANDFNQQDFRPGDFS